ncbi:MAG TPA: hypothetical protein VFC53_03955 [Dehalococcoidia bacterium]|jgi:predicted lipid-binding transport protein (Tim44 family)|nr:hypothetical protein [Dehalococcoidia bacterium]
MATERTRNNGAGGQTIEAAYPDMKRAQQALTALEWAGVEPADVSMAGPGVEEAFYDVETRDQDVGKARDVVKHAAAGVVAGATVAAAVGALAGVLIAGLAGRDWTAGGVGVAGAVGALLFGIIGWHVGGIVGGETALHTHEGAELRYAREGGGEAIVRVRARDSRTAERAAAILQAKEPMRLRRSGP